MKTISFDESVWKLVPNELTPEMLKAGEKVLWPGKVQKAFSAMLSAAPAAPEQQEQPPQECPTPRACSYDGSCRGNCKPVAQAPNAQQAEPPPWWPAVENILNEYGLQAVDFVADFKAAQQAEAQEPFAWSVFDGEGGHDLVLYAGNEDYRERFEARNPNHKNWVEPLFTRPQPAQLQALSEEEAITAWRGVKDVGDEKYNAILLSEAIQSALAAKNWAVLAVIKAKESK